MDTHTGVMQVPSPSPAALTAVGGPPVLSGAGAPAARNVAGVTSGSVHPRDPLDEVIWTRIQQLLAFVALVVLSPLLLVLYVLVRLDSSGPFIYSQLRPGRFGKPFRVYKVRTMTVGADRDARNGLAVTRNSPQVTRIGRILRASKFDELPQLWNVVRGEMALVGPRPIAQNLHDMLCEQIPGFSRRLSVRPGLTNLGQIALWDNDSPDKVVEDWRERFEAELHYLEHRTPAYDALMVAMTVLFIGFKVLAPIQRKLARLFRRRRKARS